MSDSGSSPSASADEAVERAERLVGAVREAAARTESDRRISAELVERLAEAGLFRLCVADSLGGLEADPATLVRAIETVARADGSTGWCVMIGATSGLISGYLEPEAAEEIYAADPYTITGGVFAPFGTASPRDGAYLVSGRWPFASGAEHCTWLMGGCKVVDDGGRAEPNEGQPETRMLVFPAASARIHDTWNVAGLCGTGSHDIEVGKLLVPAARSTSLTHDRPRETGRLYKFPLFGLLAVGIAAVALGVARAAIDELVGLAAEKKPSGGRRRLAERSVIQADVARAEAAVGAGRAFLLDAIERGWREASAGEISIETRARLRLAATEAVWSAAGAVDRMYHAGGGTSVYKRSPLQRAFRDVHVATQHVMVAPATWELIGRIRLGLETDATLL